MKKTRKLLALTIAVLMCLSLMAACGNSDTKDSPSASASTEASASTAPSASTSASAAPSNSAPASTTPPPAPTSTITAGAAPTSDTVRYAEEINILTDGMSVPALNPYVAGGGGAPACVWSFNLMYDRLCLMQEPGVYVPYLATSWETDDLQTFIFHLRDDVYFQNGEKFTAKDVAFSVNYGKEQVGSPAANTWNWVDEVTVIDDYTVQMLLTSPSVDFIFRVSQPTVGIICEKAVTADPDEGVWIGTGAYKLTEFVANNYWVFERNDNYFLEPAITRKITMRQIPEVATRSMMLLNGDAQICFRISAEDLELFENNPDFQPLTFVLNNPSPLYFNCEDPVTGDINFRRAVNAGLVRADIAAAMGGNTVLPAYESEVWGFATEFRNPNIPKVVEDEELAKEYLAASSYAGQEVEIACTASLTAEIIQMQLERIGIKTTINVMDNPAITPYMAWGNNQSQLSTAGMGLVLSASGIRGYVYPGLNRSSYTNMEVADLLDRAAIEEDDNTRRDLYYEVQRIVAEDLPYINVTYGINPVIAVKGIGGFELWPDALYNLRYVYWDLDA